MYCFRTLGCGLLWWVVGWQCLVCVQCVATPPDADDLTLQLMCRQGLTESAILFARDQLQRVSESDADAYARWTQRLIECEAQAAVRSVDAADSHWKRCSELVAEFKLKRAQDRRVPWIEWQAIRCDLLKSQDLLARWLAAPANRPLREQSLELVRRILERLTELEDDLKVRQPLSAKLGANDRSQAPPEQISQLRLDVVLMRCEAFLIRARLYETGSRDRVAAATNVEAEAGGLLDRTSKDWETRSSLEVARASALLDLDRRDEAITLLQAVVLGAVNEADRVRAAVLASEALIAAGDASRARAFIDLLHQLENGPEWELAEMRLTLGELTGESVTTEKKDAEIAKLLARAKSVGERYGDYWRARVDSILTNSVSSTEVAASTAADLVVVEVRQLLAAGDTKAATAKLITTSRNELAAGRKENAVQFANQAAALLQRDQKWLEAADAIETIATEAVDVSGAATGHLSAAWNLSQALKTNAQDKSLRDRYARTLADHVRLWPSSPTSEQAVQWLQTWLAGTGKQSELLPVLRERAEQAVAPEKAREAIYSWLGITLSAKPAEAELKAFEQAVTDGKMKAAEGSARVALLCAKCLPDWTDDATSKRLQAEARELVGSVTVATDRQLVAAVYLVLAARAGDASVAMGTASVWSSGALKNEMVEPIAAAIVEAVDGWPAKEVPEWAAKVRFGDEQLQVLLNSSRLTDQALGFRVRGLQSDVAAKESIVKLRELTKQNAKLGSVQLQLANALAKVDAAGLKESSDIARRLAANSDAASDLNYGARWRLVRNQQLDGKDADAERAAKLMLATISLESVGWRVRFGRLVGR